MQNSTKVLANGSSLEMQKHAYDNFQEMATEKSN